MTDGKKKAAYLEFSTNTAVRHPCSTNSTVILHANHFILPPIRSRFHRRKPTDETTILIIDPNLSMDTLDVSRDGRFVAYSGFSLEADIWIAQEKTSESK